MPTPSGFEPLSRYSCRSAVVGSRREARRAGSQEAITAITRKDRKSTRLNSSHVEISYAVFCLKMYPSPATSTLFPYTTLFRSPEELWRGDSRLMQGISAHSQDADAFRFRASIALLLSQRRSRIEARGAESGEPGGHHRDNQERSEEHTSELQSRRDLVCRLLLENVPVPRDLYTLSLHDALPISRRAMAR